MGNSAQFDLLASRFSFSSRSLSRMNCCSSKERGIRWSYCRPSTFVSWGTTWFFFVNEGKVWNIQIFNRTLHCLLLKSHKFSGIVICSRSLIILELTVLLMKSSTQWLFSLMSCLARPAVWMTIGSVDVGAGGKFSTPYGVK